MWALYQALCRALYQALWRPLPRSGWEALWRRRGGSNLSPQKERQVIDTNAFHTRKARVLKLFHTQLSVQAEELAPALHKAGRRLPELSQVGPAACA